MLRSVIGIIYRFHFQG